MVKNPFKKYSETEVKEETKVENQEVTEDQEEETKEEKKGMKKGTKAVLGILGVAAAAVTGMIIKNAVDSKAEYDDLDEDFDDDQEPGTVDDNEVTTEG